MSPTREAPILTRRALQSIAGDLRVHHESDGMPPLLREPMFRPERTLTKLVRLAIDRGLIQGVTFHPATSTLQASVGFSPEALRDTYEVMAEVAWPHRDFPRGAIQEAQHEIRQLLLSVGRIPDFAVRPQVEANR